MVIGTAYFLASRLGLSLLVPPSDVAVFWPAAGISAGILIAFGRRAFVPLAIGVMIGTIKRVERSRPCYLCVQGTVQRY